jgi:hypothetical protein
MGKERRKKKEKVGLVGCLVGCKREKAEREG